MHTSPKLFFFILGKNRIAWEKAIVTSIKKQLDE